MWLTMAAAASAPATDDTRKALKRSLTDQYQAAVGMLNYHVGLLHPTMLSLHFALAYYHLTVSSASSSTLSPSSPLFVLLSHCHQFSQALFSSRKPLTCQLALMLGDGYDRAGDVAQSCTWIQLAVDGMGRWLDGSSKGRVDDVERTRVKEKREWAMAAIKRIQHTSTDKKRGDEEKEQMNLA